MQRKDKRRAMFVKARNIRRNNMEKNRHQYIRLTAKTAPRFIGAYKLFQLGRQKARRARMAYLAIINKKLAASK